MKWLKIFTNPKEFFEEEKFNASNIRAIKIVGIAGIIAGAIFSIGIIFFSCNNPDTWICMLSSIYDKNILSYLLPPIFFPINSIIAVWIASGILYKFARIFGGKGNFTTQTYLLSFIAVPCVITYIIFLMFADVANKLFIWTLEAIVIVYLLYLLTLALKETHEYATKKAVLTWAVPMTALILFIIFINIIIPKFVFNML